MIYLIVSIDSFKVNDTVEIKITPSDTVIDKLSKNKKNKFKINDTITLKNSDKTYNLMPKSIKIEKSININETNERSDIKSLFLNQLTKIWLNNSIEIYLNLNLSILKI